MAAPRIETLADPEALARHAAEWLTGLAEASTGAFTLALSGGSTPKRLFELLAEPLLRDRFPWARTHLFWGDERFVPADDKASNYGMTRRALLDHVAIPEGHVHPMPTTGTLEAAAREYQAILQAHYGRESLDMTRPLFDVTLLGLGENGHTASLFPGSKALDELVAWVAPVTEGVPQPRLTLTYPAIGCSKAVAFLAAGQGKAHVVRAVMENDRSLPATRVEAAGQLLWFLDEAAASRLKR